MGWKDFSNGLDSNRLAIGYQIWATTPTHGRTKQNDFFSVSQDWCNKK